uniref:Uncharacterized protein n=1 Tax=Sphaerodactylus townsendi TaxID=933632 RepID=A0ACB8G3Q6_9SAUR
MQYSNSGDKKAGQDPVFLLPHSMKGMALISCLYSRTLPLCLWITLPYLSGSVYLVEQVGLVSISQFLYLIYPGLPLLLHQIEYPLTNYFLFPSPDAMNLVWSATPCCLFELLAIPLPSELLRICNIHWLRELST